MAIKLPWLPPPSPMGRIPRLWNSKSFCFHSGIKFLGPFKPAEVFDINPSMRFGVLDHKVRPAIWQGKGTILADMLWSPRACGVFATSLSPIDLTQSPLWVLTRCREKTCSRKNARC